MNKSELFTKVVCAAITDGFEEAVVITGSVMKVIRYTSYCTAGIYSCDDPHPVTYDDIIDNLVESGTAHLTGKNPKTRIDFYIGEG